MIGHVLFQRRSTRCLGSASPLLVSHSESSLSFDSLPHVVIGFSLLEVTVTKISLSTSTRWACDHVAGPRRNELHYDTNLAFAKIHG